MHFKKYMLAGAAAVMMSGAAFSAAHAATADLTIDAVIIDPITFTCGTNLDFGDIVAPTGGAGSVTMATDGTRTPDGTEITAAELIGSSGAAGSCDITGANGQTVDITSPASTTISEVGGATMTVNNFTVNPAGGGEQPFPVNPFSTTGAPQTLLIGADLQVSQNQVAGDYSGTITFTANYN